MATTPASEDQIPPSRPRRAAAKRASSSPKAAQAPDAAGTASTSVPAEAPAKAARARKPKAATAKPAAEAAVATALPPTGDSFPGSGYVPAIGRIPILDLQPQLVDNLFPTKGYVGDVVPFSCVSFREGHDIIGVELVINAHGAQAQRIRMQPGPKGTDSWLAEAQVTVAGPHEWWVEAWNDDFATWQHNAEIKIPAGIDVDVMLELGALVVDRAATNPELTDHQSAVLRDAATASRFTSRSAAFRLASLLAEDVLEVIEAHPVRSLVTRSAKRTVLVERALAGNAAWYEFFPRSEGAKQAADGSWTSGTFRTAAERIPAVAAMNFDVLYVPPIHPIGHTNRKGPNNSLMTEPGDPGSPWAIGAAEGGHRDIHPDLGTVEDFRYFVGEIERHGMELALDLALQATPDHPWVAEHPDWFTQLPDGSIAYAENPPKKYQDIYPINFDGDRNGLYAEVLDTVEYWIGLGVKIFRVDNPHTKPLQFWEWLIHEVNAKHPEVIFLAEAFTRPAVMHALAKAGFQQSYTYFTWRNTKTELEEYLTEVSKESSDFLRPNFFVNTPDILTEYLQQGGRNAAKIRAIVAATSSPLWGVYAGFELAENVARPGSEENIDNEKYEYKQRDWAAQEASGYSLAPLLTKLNELRRANPALQQLRNFEVQFSDNENVLVFSKHLPAEYSPDGVSNTVIVAVNLNHSGIEEATVYIDQTKFGFASDTEFGVEDLLSGHEWIWGGANYVRLDPSTLPAHILRVRHSAL
ncbi:alpha-1,4-glucan--maltose-1-phosphate maltosyltransferase [Pseudoclavibacter helvolus]|uniref:alpha-1,4-glucan--maltose-1-phosphate maltosyltransferase n=1 Tax=Pseudoclavibacter helvolus TaxID=255205 RepID=UPI0024AD0C95|nr:alpha-1,4-glucan--maltose-1-phosphate maltosyltransferase [Pseudoclavibacter helvolus]